MPDLPHVLNWRRRDPRTTLSGQPSETQLAEIKALGVSHVINLGPHTNKGALEDEAGTVSALGMTYVYIPVDFDNPTDEDFTTFCEAFDNLPETPVHVHCIYNARVSAFFYRYAKDGRGGSPDDAHALMESVWRPGGVWARFIGKDDDADQPNRYAGDDY